MERELRHAVERRGHGGAGGLEDGRGDIGDEVELAADGIALRDTRGPVDDERDADAAGVDETLGEAEGRVAGLRPTQRIRAEGLRAAEGVEAFEAFAQRAGLLGVEELHLVPETELAALGAGAVVGEQNDEGVAEAAGALEFVEQAAELAVGVLEVGGEGFVVAGEDAALVGGEGGPGPDAGIVGREDDVGGDEPHFLLAGEGGGADGVPAGVEAPAPFLEVVGRGVVRGVAGAVGEVEEVGAVGGGGAVVGDVADGAVGEIGVEEVGRAVAEFDGRIDAVAVLEEIGGEVVGVAAEVAVEAVEAAAGGPVGGRGGGVLFLLRDEVPFADGGGAVAAGAEEFGDGRGFRGEAAAAMRETVGEFGDDADAGAVGIAAGEQGGAGGRANGKRGEVRVPHAAGGEAVDVGRGDGRAVAAELGEPDVVEDDEQDVGRTGGRAGRGGPGRGGFGDGARDGGGSRGRGRGGDEGEGEGDDRGEKRARETRVKAAARGEVGHGKLDTGWSRSLTLAATGRVGAAGMLLSTLNSELSTASLRFSARGRRGRLRAGVSRGRSCRVWRECRRWRNSATSGNSLCRPACR